MTASESLTLSPCLNITPTPARGNWVTLNVYWQNGKLSNSFQRLAADSIIKIIKRGEMGERENCIPLLNCRAGRLAHCSNPLV